MVTIYREIDVVSSLASEHRKGDFDRARKSKLTAKEDVEVGCVWSPGGVQNASGVQMESKSFARKSFVLIQHGL
jgi:hypothetical protein